MRCFTLLLTVIFTTASLAGDDLSVLDSKSDVPKNKLLYQYLLREAGKHFEVRDKTVQALSTPDEIKERQAYLKKKFIESLGGFPKKTPLNAKITGKIDKGDYSIEKVIFESRPDHHVTAIFYLPKGSKKKYPGVLVPCGHSANGKAAEAYQRVCILMAKNGLAVLCYDPIGQGERSQLLNDKGKPAVPGSTSEHTMVGVGALLVGRNAATYRIWDGIRSLDYLASRPEVDAKRLGCTGNSGGGTLTAYLMALDERIIAAAPSCYITSLEKLFSTIGPQDAEQNITGQVAFGMNHADYVTMRAPLPTLICVGTKDYFNIDGAWNTFREAKMIYGKLGYGGKVSLFEYNDPHGFSKPRRQAAMRWMRRWLLGKNDFPFEEDFEIFTDEQLQCSRTGQVLSSLHGKSAFHLNAELEKELKKKRVARLKSQSPEIIKKTIRRLIGLKEEAGGVNFEKKKTIKRKGYKIDAYVGTGKGGVPIPLYAFVPDKRAKQKSDAVYVSGNGVAEDIKSIEALVLAGQVVFAADLRGFGETAPKKSNRGLSKYFGDDWQEAFLGLHLNRPLLGQRVEDLNAVINFVRKSTSEGTLHLIGVGSAGPVALHAAVLNPNVTSLTLKKSLTSWTDVVHTPISVNQLTNAVPGVLAYYDLPDLVRMIAPRSVSIESAVNAAGSVVSSNGPK